MTLDLDALERHLAEAQKAMAVAEEDGAVPMAEVWQPEAQIELYFAAADALPALIQRLREAEARWAERQAADDDIRAAIEGNVDRLVAAEARIAQLERVRKAAQTLLDTLGQHGEPELRAALDAVTSDSKAQSSEAEPNAPDTALKAG